MTTKNEPQTRTTTTFEKKQRKTQKKTKRKQKKQRIRRAKWKEARKPRKACSEKSAKMGRTLYPKDDVACRISHVNPSHAHDVHI